VAWTAPKTWTSEPLTSIDLNAQLRDNQNHLKDRLDNSANRIVNHPGNYTTTSTSFVDVDATKLSLTLTTHGGDVLLGLTATAYQRTHGASIFFNIAVDSVDYFADNGIARMTVANSGDIHRHKPLCLVVLIPGLSAGSHTFKLRWKVSDNSTAVIDANSLHPQFWAKEL